MDKTAAMECHTHLLKEGWERRFTAEEPRLSEMKEFYESLGLEVLMEAGIPEDAQECSGCFSVEGFQERYRTIYTRPKSGAEGRDAGLFDD